MSEKYGNGLFSDLVVLPPSYDRFKRGGRFNNNKIRSTSSAPPLSFNWDDLFKPPLDDWHVNEYRIHCLILETQARKESEKEKKADWLTSWERMKDD